MTDDMGGRVRGAGATRRILAMGTLVTITLLVVATPAATAAVFPHPDLAAAMRPLLAAPAAGGVTVEIVPPKITVPLTGTVSVIAVVTNTTAGPILARPTLIANSLVGTPALTPAALPAGSSHAFRVDLARLPDAVLPGSAVLQTDWWAAGTTPPAAPTSSIATVLDLSAGPESTVDSVATISTDAGTTRVDDVHDSRISVILVNKSLGPIQVLGLDLDKPDYIDAHVETSTAFPLTIDAQSSQAVVVVVRGQGALQKGSAQLAVRANLSWGAAVGTENAETGSLLITHPLDVGAFGESDLGTVLAVPTLLLLPGVVTLLLLGLLWVLGIRPLRKSDATPFPLSAVNPQFWVVAVLISAAAVALFWVIQARSLLAGYGSRDVLLLVLWTVGVVVFGYLCWCLWMVWRRHRQRLRAGMTPQAVLQTLQRRGGGLWLPVAAQRRGTGSRLVLVPNAGRADEPVLVCVPIQVGLALSVSRPSELDQQLEREICHALRRDADAAELTAALRRAGGTATLGWRTAKNLSGLEPAVLGDLTPVADPAPLVVLG